MNDDQLGALLTDTFRSRESQVDADHAVGLTRDVPAARRPWVPVTLAAAAAIVLALATSYAVTRGGDRHPVADPPPSSPTSTSRGPGSGMPPGVVLHTADENRAYTRRLVADVADALRAQAPEGAREATADEVAPLKRLTTFSGTYGGRFDVDRSLFFLVPGDAHALARWYVAHPIDGYRADGAEAADPEGGVGGSSLADGGWSYDVYFYAPDDDSDQGSASIQLQTTQLGDRTGVRATIFGQWLPPRPASSYATDVTSVGVTLVRTIYGSHTPRHHPRRWTIADPARVDRIVAGFNGLAGWVPFFHSCPLMGDVKTYHVVLHSPHGDVTFVDGPGCYDVGKVRRDGHRVGPWLASAHTVTDLVDDAPR